MSGVVAPLIHDTVELGMKFLPFTVSVKPVLPVATAAGEIEVSVGMGFVIAKLIALELVEPPRTAVMLAEPIFATSAAVTLAVSFVAETKVVVSEVADPAVQVTTSPLWKPVPFTVSVKAADAAVLLAGANVVRTGAIVEPMVTGKAVEAIPFATTNRLLAPASTPAGTATFVVMMAAPVATPIELCPDVRQ